MRLSYRATLVVTLALSAAGCGQKKPFDGPTVDSFGGKLTAVGQPVSFQPGQDVTLQLFHEKGQSFGVPVRPDGSFQIGWMPTGRYAAMLIRKANGPKAGSGKYNVPGGLTVEDGKAQYTIDLGKGWKAPASR